MGLVGGWLVAPLILGSCYEVFSRYVLGRPTIWAFEAGTLLTGANFLLGMAYTLRAGAHIRVEALYDLFSEKVRAAIDFLGYVLLAFPFVCWLTWALNNNWIKAYASNEHSGMSAFNMVLWPIRLVFFISFLVLALQMLAEILKRARILFGTKA
ncbi:MAG: TRAP transporter small permease subunit [Rhodospirillales bacterium]|nr:TRAP transporter small permease subunit [Rhodospirillales bacterium]